MQPPKRLWTPWNFSVVAQVQLINVQWVLLAPGKILQFNSTWPKEKQNETIQYAMDSNLPWLG
jgi:hypothetical protein